MPTVTLYTKPGCHLCEVALATVEDVVAEYAPRVSLTVLSILDDPALAERYAEDIPVVVVDGVQHAQWRVDAQRLRERIESSLSTQVQQ